MIYLRLAAVSLLFLCTQLTFADSIKTYSITSISMQLYPVFSGWIVGIARGPRTIRRQSEIEFEEGVTLADKTAHKRGYAAETIEQAETTAPTPEPGTIALTLTGLIKKKQPIPVRGCPTFARSWR